MRQRRPLTLTQKVLSRKIFVLTLQRDQLRIIGYHRTISFHGKISRALSVNAGYYGRSLLDFSKKLSGLEMTRLQEFSLVNACVLTALIYKWKTGTSPLVMIISAGFFLPFANILMAIKWARWENTNKSK